MSEYTVVAFHGLIAGRCTPGLHGPVVIDASGHMLRGNGEVDPDVLITAEGPLPGEGTRVGPWPYVPGAIVITVDRPLLRAARALAYQRGVTGSVWDLLEAENQNGEALRAHHAERLAATPTVVAWYSSRANIDALRVLLRDVAHDKLMDTNTRDGIHLLRARAWQLQRSAMNADDDLLAIAALHVSGLDKADVQELLEDLVKDLPARTRTARFKAAVAVVKGWQKPTSDSAASRAQAQARAPHTDAPKKEKAA